MKRLLLSLLALTLLGACGKENKSGKNEWSYSDTYLGNYDSSRVPGNVNSVISAIPCMSGYGNSTARQHVQLPLTGFGTVIPQGDIYVGITSYGDVGVLYGQGSNTPMFIAYLCPRDFTNFQSSTLSNVRVGSYSNCSFKPVASATITFPTMNMGMPATAEFRMMDFGYNNGSSLVKIPNICK